MGEANFYYFTCLNIRLNVSFSTSQNFHSLTTFKEKDGHRSAIHALEPQAVPQRSDGQASHGQAQMGHGIQGISRLRRRMHESPVGQHGRVHRRGAGGEFGRSSDPLQQRPTSAESTTKMTEEKCPQQNEERAVSSFKPLSSSSSFSHRL